MVLLGELAEGLLDIGLARLAGHAEDVVGIAHRSYLVGSSSGGSAAARSAPLPSKDMGEVLRARNYPTGITREAGA
ncbi:hypothetical protein GCM10011322_16580 [Salinarimonas ramus]|uniref:Uncharacterized protein n=1 Tax=Salinarimonas ramus TaxID=690164 RepID=A0A917Q657_9HYPH|nr:hypothetical protein GCM10011322_16580 [Salinarimonas ramus]